MGSSQIFLRTESRADQRNLSQCDGFGAESVQSRHAVNFVLYICHVQPPHFRNFVKIIHISLPPVISTSPRKWFWWHFLLMLGIHARNILWGMTMCPRLDDTCETSN